jgi:hypothetical protein
LPATIKTGHCKIQIRPLRVKTGQYPNFGAGPLCPQAQKKELKEKFGIEDDEIATMTSERAHQILSFGK